jgi:tetratricopeptide (TPR) repeat protein
MKTRLPRLVFDLIYWGGIGAAAYSSTDLFLLKIKPNAEAWLGPYAFVAFVVGGVGALLFFSFLKTAIANTALALHASLTHSRPVEFEGTQREGTLIRAARKHEKRGDFAQAAEIYESLEVWPEAADAFEKGGLYGRAANLWIKAGENAKAISLFEKDKQFDLAASTALSEGLRDRAIRNFRLAAEAAIADNSFLKAAQFFEKAQDFERAGDMFQTLKRLEDALRCYEKGAVTGKIEELVKSFEPSMLASGREVSPELVRRAAELLARDEKPLQGAELLRNTNDFVRAAEMFEKAQAWDKAGEAYLLAEMLDRAEKCYSRLEDRAKVAEFLARIAIQKGDWQAAGHRFVEADKPTQAVDAYKRAKDFLSAARVYEQSKRFLMAAEMYSAAREIRLAGEAYEKGHDWRNAAECFESVGNLREAMQAYVAAGDFFRAGRLAIKLADSLNAIEYLQRVSPTSPDWKIATGHLATAFYQQGRTDLAREMFQRVVDQIAPSFETLPIFYAYGRLLEDDGSPDAIGVFRRILAIDVKHEDVVERIAKIESRRMEQQRIEPFMEHPAGGMERKPPSPTIRTGTQTQTHHDARKPITQPPETRFGEEGRYQIIGELGRGGMAIVYKAFDLHLEREVALKTFPLSRHSGPGREDIFLREARLVARLSHPNIVTIFDCGHMNFLYYIAMEYVQGENLKQLVKRKGPMSVEEMKSTITQVADALMYAHSQQVLHRDVKPGNVILRQSGDIKVVDFGVAKIISDAATNVAVEEDSQRTLVGTPQYMAPEQILGTGVDVRTDIYAMGLTLFFLVTGRTPFDVKKISDPVEISRMQVHSSFPRPSTLRATLPAKLDDVFVRCTQKSPSDRYASVKVFMEDFAKL